MQGSNQYHSATEDWNLWDDILPIAEIGTRLRVEFGEDVSLFIGQSHGITSTRRPTKKRDIATPEALLRHLEIVLEDKRNHRASVARVQIERGRIIGLPPEDLGMSFLWQTDN